VTRVVVIGAGVGGLAASVRLARAGCDVTLVEATSSVGGLARAVDIDGQRADGGPYILLDRPGLEWAFARLELAIDDLALTRIERVYRVEAAGAPDVHIDADLDATASALDRDFPGAGRRYRIFVDDMARVHRALAPLLVREHSRLALLSTGAVRHAATLLRSLGSVLRRSGLPEPVVRALGIWTAVAGQELDEAPMPMALVPALIHTAGCYLPAGGVAAVVDALATAATRSGVRILTDRRVERIEVDGGRATGVRLGDDLLAADAVVSGAAGASTLLELVDPAPRLAARVRALPLQSPGLALFGVADPPRTGPYLTFRRTPEHSSVPCRLAINPAAVHAPAGAAVVRLIAPLRPGAAEKLDSQAMSALLDELRADPWLADRLPGFAERRAVTPADYGRASTLYRDSMNPVMTARFMRQGRMPRRAPGVARLYLVGSSTHPGQWVSFAAISGVLGADAVLADLRRH
jgi:phytoene dehydrogenase-like protein